MAKALIDNMVQIGEYHVSCTLSTQSYNIMTFTICDITAPASGRQSRRNWIEICFHVIVSPSMFEDPKTDEVYIKFENPELDGWQSLNHKMEFVKDVGEGYMYYQKVIHIPPASAQRQIIHNYCVKHGTYTKMEYFYDRILKRDDSHRSFYIPQAAGKGIINQKPDQSFKNWLKKAFGFDSFEKLLRNDHERAFSAFFPRWPSSLPEMTDTADEFLDTIQNIYNGLKYVYQTSADLWSSLNDFNQYFGQALGGEMDNNNMVAPMVSDHGSDNSDTVLPVPPPRDKAHSLSVPLSTPDSYNVTEILNKDLADLILKLEGKLSSRFDLEKKMEEKYDKKLHETTRNLNPRLMLS
ncbi:hypothetical protein KUTeg_007055 [Tegillarca granosa]|uniref:Uncharacterized protein n=1 Tax=Tegillarca granosa TaxID=220873 RepID=A0ABQ9FF65_TEGGR|nr:hypothetical protein KUTeg_007055 [Tegillarca granosa]